MYFANRGNGLLKWIPQVGTKMLKPFLPTNFGDLNSFTALTFETQKC